MKAISIQQPWAWAILHAGKDVENRTWRTTYRGPVAIHASKAVDPEGSAFLASLGLVDWRLPCAAPTGGGAAYGLHAVAAFNSARHDLYVRREARDFLRHNRRAS